MFKTYFYCKWTYNFNLTLLYGGVAVLKVYTATFVGRIDTMARKAMWTRVISALVNICKKRKCYIFDSKSPYVQGLSRFGQSIYLLKNIMLHFKHSTSSDNRLNQPLATK